MALADMAKAILVQAEKTVAPEIFAERKALCAALADTCVPISAINDIPAAEGTVSDAFANWPHFRSPGKIQSRGCCRCGHNLPPPSPDCVLSH